MSGLFSYPPLLNRRATKSDYSPNACVPEKHKDNHDNNSPLKSRIRKDTMVEGQNSELHKEGRPGVDLSEDKFALECSVSIAKALDRDSIPKESSVNLLAT